MQWIPKQIVAIGEDFHSQVGDGKVRTTLYKFVGKDTTRKTKHILKARTQMVESMHKYFDAGLSDRAKLYICTLLDPSFKDKMWSTHKYVTIHTYAQRVCSVAKLNDRG
jgi:hypothetical protein